VALVRLVPLPFAICHLAFVEIPLGLGWLWGRIGVALGWLWGAYAVAIRWLCGGSDVALGWLWAALPFLHSSFCLHHSPRCGAAAGRRHGGIRGRWQWHLNFYLLTVEQFKWQKKERDQTRSTMLAAPRLFIIGDDQAVLEL
jgi:hypothetical protein